MIRPTSSFVVAALCALTGFGCANVRFNEDLDHYRDDVERLQTRLLRNPDDAEALRDLGVIYLRTNHDAESLEYLRRAFTIDADDPKTSFYFGLANERVGKMDTSLRLYEIYSHVSPLSPYRKLLQGRYEWLSRKIMRDEVQRALVEERRLTADDASPRRVAVLPLLYLGTRREFAPLSHGIGEMLTVDLSQVSGITVVERIRVQALIDELSLSERSFVDGANAPRMGRLLGAGRMVSGTYNVLGGDNLRMDVGVWSWRDAPQPRLASGEGLLNRLLKLEKDLVFALLEEMGIEPTPAERERIRTIPTENFQAFLVYSRGLEREDARDFRGAAALFGRAAALDPGFQEAAQRAEAAEAMSEASGEVKDVLLTAWRLESPYDVINLVDNRLRHLSESIHSSLFPGQDSRRPAQEGIPEGLPLPPPPPPR